MKHEFKTLETLTERYERQRRQAENFYARIDALPDMGLTATHYTEDQAVYVKGDLRETLQSLQGLQRPLNLEPMYMVEGHRRFFAHSPNPALPKHGQGTLLINSYYKRINFVLAGIPVRWTPTDWSPLDHLRLTDHPLQLRFHVDRYKHMERLTTPDELLKDLK